MVKSLITSTGLESGWQRVRKRLAAVEDSLGRVKTAIDDREFVFRGEYSDLVETRHAGQLSKLSSEVASLSGLQDELTSAVREQMQPELNSCSEKLQAAQGQLESLESGASALKGANGELRETVQRLERSVDDRMAQSSRDVDARFAALEAAVRAQAEDTSDKMRELEERMQAWTVTEIKRVALELMDPDEGDSDDELGEEEERQAEEDGDSEPLQVRQSDCAAAGAGGGEHLSVHAAAAGGDMMKESRKGSKKFSNRSNLDAGSSAGVDGSKSTEPKGAVQKKVMELVKRTIADPIRHDISLSAARLAALEEKTAKKTEDLGRQIRVAEKSLDSFKGSTGATMEEIREELESCFKASTAAQLETALTSSVGELWTELQELRQTATGKLNEFVEHFAKVHESIEDHEHCLRHHAEEIEGRCTKYEMLACQRELDETVTKEEFDRFLADTREVLGWQSNKIEGFGLVAASNPSRRARTTGSVGSANKGSGAAADSRGAARHRGIVGEDEGDAAGRNQRMLADQLNALAMGVVWLAHLLLREPKIGASRGQRLAQERELLEELGSLRHWITHQSSPAGWDTCKLTTATLECSHTHAASPRQPHPSTAPAAAASRSSAPMPSVREKHVMSAREVRDWTKWVGEEQRSLKPPNSARSAGVLKESRGSVNGASQSTFASDGDVRSNQTSRERLPSMGRGRGGAEDLKASPASSATSLPPVRTAAF